MKARVKVEMQRACEVASLPPVEDARAWCEAALDASGKAGSRACEIVVRVVDEQESRELNSRYRQQDRPTNVLAFPAGEDDIPGLPPKARRALGDLVICGPVVEREAREQGKEAAVHWGHLLVHGALHLLGYDHQTGAEAAEMERLETAIMTGRGFDDPYA